MMNRSRVGVGAVLLTLMLAACASGTEATVTTSPVSPVFYRPEFDDRAELIDSLRQSGLSVTAGEQVIHPFFDVAGQRIELDGAELQVFQYPSVTARREDSQAIAPDGYTIGDTQVSWVRPPNFWAQGRLIVLYLGVDKEVIQLMSERLGEPITSRPDYPQAVLAAQKHLSQQRDVPLQQVRIVSYEHVQWRNGCLELARPDEMCTQAITPGWRVVLISEGQEYVLHTDERGAQVRIKM